ncbi:LuxR C-terminal-related transcriptional regulator [Microvirga sp. 2YAF29]|uniref:LuxR C-terminal-related transcriptional regulator n=1 Tax=Microvirga sp. 2YAF29 TaxID=3233031 RepID=UPI003F95FA4D
MSQAFAYRNATINVARDSAQSISTYLICSNSLLRSGFDHILSGTQFSLSDEVYKDHIDLPQIGGTDPILLIVCTHGTMNEPEQIVEGLRETCPKARIVIVADHLDPTILVRACKAGVDGVCSTDMDRDVLLKALELVMLGERFIPSSMGLALLEANPNELRGLDGDKVVPLHTSDSAPQSLSTRETQILRCLIDGSSNKHIARQLGVAEATVKVHIKAILRKAKVANRTQAAMWAQRRLNQGPVASSD